MKMEILPSLLAADIGRLADEIARAEQARAEDAAGVTTFSYDEFGSLTFPTTANLGSMFATLATMCSFTAALRWRCFAHFMHQ